MYMYTLMYNVHIYKYSGPFILKPPIHPEECGLKLKV